MANNAKDKIKETADNINRVVKEGITYHYQFDTTSVLIMGGIGVATVILVTIINWYLDRSKT